MAVQIRVVGEFRTRGVAGGLEFVPLDHPASGVDLPGLEEGTAPPSPVAEALGYMAVGLEGDAVVMALLDGSGGLWTLAPYSFPEDLEVCMDQVHAAAGQWGPPSLLVALAPEVWERAEDEMCDLIACAVRKVLGPMGYLPLYIGSAAGTQVNWWELNPWADEDGAEGGEPH